MKTSATITWFGHSTVRLLLEDGRVIMIDPWLAENPACPDELKTLDRCDLVLLTHGHFDHVADVGRLIRQFNPKIVGNYDLCAALEHTIGAGHYCGMNTGGMQQVDGVRVSLTKAFHSSALSGPNGPIYAGMPNGLVIDAPGLARVYHAGDTDVFGDMALIRRLWDPKIAILPIGDLFTMGAAGAAIAAELLKPDVIVPIHYQTFPILAQSADEFRTALPAELKRRLLVPEVGQAMNWSAAGLTL
ncbi:MAG: metal-dependent hydrolase [Phycisphaerales bacterium]|nr:MAG: metal-dependent hydrolase [Phycisphaerales bacterium]